MSADNDSEAIISASFNRNADMYEARTGGCTRIVASYIVDNILIPALTSPTNDENKSLHIHDNACGTAQVTTELFSAYASQLHSGRITAKPRITCTDFSSAMVSIAQELVAGNRNNQDATTSGLWKRVEAREQDGTNMADISSDTFDLSVTNMGLFLMTDPPAGAREIHRTLKPGALAVASCWKVIGFVPVFYAVQRLVKPAAPVPEHVVPFEEWTRMEKIRDVMVDAGFDSANVEVREVPSFMGGKKEDVVFHALRENMKGLVGARWSEDEIARLDEAIWKFVRGDEPNEFFAKGKQGEIGIDMVAFVCIAKK